MGDQVPTPHRWNAEWDPLYQDVEGENIHMERRCTAEINIKFAWQC